VHVSKLKHRTCGSSSGGQGTAAFPGLRRTLTRRTVGAAIASENAVAAYTHATNDLPWRLDEVDFSALNADLVREDERLFFLLVSASLVESGSDVYTHNLLAYFAAEPDLADWLTRRWEPEELQHGRALRAYVAHVWPDFDWPLTFQRFFGDYQAICSVEQFAPTPTLELAARCMVETGTASYYRMLHESTHEPVLRVLLNNIRSDEVRHFKYFYRFFRERNARERGRRARVGLALARRLREAVNDDAYCAFRHAYAARYPTRPNTIATFRRFRRDVEHLAHRHFPYRMAAEMFLTPLALPGVVRGPVVRTLAGGIRVFGL
jgi:hypothetical protein